MKKSGKMMDLNPRPPPEIQDSPGSKAVRSQFVDKFYLEGIIFK